MVGVQFTSLVNRVNSHTSCIPYMKLYNSELLVSLDTRIKTNKSKMVTFKTYLWHMFIHITYSIYPFIFFTNYLLIYLALQWFKSASYISKNQARKVSSLMSERDIIILIKKKKNRYYHVWVWPKKKEILSWEFVIIFQK